MDERRLDDLLNDAATSYRVPPAAKLDTMWQRIEAEAFAPAPRRVTDWRMIGLAAAASLVVGVFAGRATATGPVTPAATVATANNAAATAQSVSDPSHRTAEEVLGRTAVLLTALRSEARQGTLSPGFNEQATQLLSTTRLLIDSPVSNDPQLKNLLQDLELVLAQVARMQPSRGKNEINLITTSLDEHDLVPRIRSAVVDLAGGGGGF